MNSIQQAGAPVTLINKQKQFTVRTPQRSVAQTGHRTVRTAQGSELPLLAIALDYDAMTRHLAAHGTTILEPGATVIDIQLLDCKPGKRALIRYELAQPTQEGSTVLFGKLYADPGQLARAHQTLHTLWSEIFRATPACSVPQPLGILSALSMLLYVPAEGRFLDETLAGGQATEAVEQTARWLGTLHRYPLQIAKRFQLADELANLAGWAAFVGQNYPELGSLADQLLAYLQQQAALTPLSGQTPIHKDFHYRHVLVDGGVKVIDFDELRLGDPNFDLAHFCTNWQLLAYRQYGSPHRLRKLEARFLAAYAEETGWTPTEHAGRFTYFYVYTCLKLARQLCLGVGPSPVPTGADQRRQVQLILRLGVACISQFIGREQWTVSNDQWAKAVPV
jgi:hypothetical protein